MEARPQTTRLGAPGWGALLLVLGLAALVRFAFSLSKGLVLDEFHTYYHATRDSLTSLFDGLARDNHPPLSFLVIRAARSLFGEAEWALRLPALLCGILEVALVWVIAQRLPGRRGLAAAGLLAASSLHLDFSTQARMYAFLSLAVIGCLEATSALTAELDQAGRSRWAPWRLAFWLVVGAHAHYFFLQYCAWSLIAILGWSIANRHLASTLRTLAAPVGVALLLSAPWYATGFREQFEHTLPPGGKDGGLLGWAEALVHLFFLNLRLGGPLLRMAFIAAGGVLLALAGWGALQLALRARERSLTWLLITVGFAVPAWAAALAVVWARAGFTWHYILPSSAAVALLASEGLGAGPLRPLRKSAFAVALGLAITLSVLNARGPGSEDFRGALRQVSEKYRPGDAIVAVEWQPNLFPQHQPITYYAARLAPELPPPLAMNANYSLANPAELDGYERVLLLRTDLPDNQHLMGLLRERYQQVSWADFGFGVQVFEFER